MRIPQIFIPAITITVHYVFFKQIPSFITTTVRPYSDQIERTVFTHYHQPAGCLLACSSSLCRHTYARTHTLTLTQTHAPEYLDKRNSLLTKFIGYKMSSDNSTTTYTVAYKAWWKSTDYEYTNKDTGNFFSGDTAVFSRKMAGGFTCFREPLQAYWLSFSYLSLTDRLQVMRSRTKL